MKQVSLIILLLFLTIFGFYAIDTMRKNDKSYIGAIIIFFMLFIPTIYIAFGN